MKRFFREHWLFIVIAVAIIAIVVNYDAMLQGSRDANLSVSSPGMGVEGGYATDYDYAIPEQSPSAPVAVSKDQANSRMFIDPSMPPIPGEFSDAGVDSVDRMIIRSANMTLKVDRPEKTFEEIKTYVTSIKGFIENATVSEMYEPPVIYYEDSGKSAQTDTDFQKQVSATIRIPDESFDAALTKFREYGYVASEGITGQDVTATYRDNEARLVNMKAREAKLREFYAKAKNLDETLQVFQQLEQARYEIEALESQQKNLDRQISYSTIWLSLQPNTAIEPFADGEWNFREIWAQAVNDMLITARGFVELFVRLAVNSVIWVPLLVILWLIMRFVKRRQAAKKGNL